MVKSPDLSSIQRTLDCTRVFAAIRHPVCGLAACELPLLLGLRPDSLWVILGGLYLAVVLMMRWGSGRPLEVTSLVGSRLLVILGVLMLGVWAALIPFKYYSLGYTAFDTGIFAGELSAFVTTGHYWSSIQKVPALRDHFNPNLLLLSPLVSADWISSLALLHILKLAAHVGSAIILYRLSSVLLGSDSLYRLAAPTFWLLNSYVSRTLEFEFQPSSLAVPFVLLSFLYAATNRRGSLLLVLIFLLGFKESLSISWVAVGIFLVSRNRKDTWGWIIIGVGCIAGPVIYLVVMPSFGGINIPPHSTRFGPLALLPQKAALIAQAILSVGGLPLLAPRTLLWLIPSFGLALISKEPQMVTFNFHYQDTALAALFVAAVSGLASLQKTGVPLGLQKFSPKAEGFKYLGVVAVLATHVWFPTRSLWRHIPTNETVAAVAELAKLSDRIPTSCTVMAMNSVGAYLYRIPTLEIISNLDEKFANLDKYVFVLARDRSPWPLTDTEYRRLEKKLQTEATLQVAAGYEHMQVFVGRDCSVL